MNKLITQFGLCLALCSSLAARDWQKHPAVVQVDNASEVFAMGDAHGDYVRLTTVLRAAHLIDKDNNWTGGTAVLVSTGDMIDKGPRGLDVLRLYRQLRQSAPAAGGHVIVLSGNHEAEFLADSAVPKAKDFVSELKAAGIEPSDVAACKGDIGEFLCTLPFAARVNDAFFSHAGSSKGRTIAQLEADIKKDFDKHGFFAEQITGDGSVIEARLNGEGKGREPWIDAGLPARSEKQLLQDYAKALGVGRIVEGHVPSEVKFTDGTTRAKGEMFQRFGLLYLIDTGMSEGVGDSHGAILQLNGKTATAICADGTKTQLAPVETDFARVAPCGSPL